MEFPYQQKNTILILGTTKEIDRDRSCALHKQQSQFGTLLSSLIFQVTKHTQKSKAQTTFFLKHTYRTISLFSHHRSYLSSCWTTLLSVVMGERECRSHIAINRVHFIGDVTQKGPTFFLDKNTGLNPNCRRKTALSVQQPLGPVLAEEAEWGCNEEVLY